MENYIGSQQHFEDNVNEHYDNLERENQSMQPQEQIDDRVQERILYRYDSYWLGDEYPVTVKVYLRSFKVIRETPKCYVIKGEGFGKNGKQNETHILKDYQNNGKRFAYDTKENAYNGYLHRCRRRELITRNQWERSKEVYKVAQDKEKLLSLVSRSNELW